MSGVWVSIPSVVFEELLCDLGEHHHVLCWIDFRGDRLRDCGVLRTQIKG